MITLFLVACGNEEPADKSADETSQQLNAEGVVAKVDDELITFNELNLMLNSSAMVGLSIPALGTPDRNQVIITLLDKMISANLLYLDAKKNGADRLTKYVDDMKKFEDAVLVTMYRSNVMIGDIPVSEEEVAAYYKTNINPETEFTDDVKLSIEAKIRKQRFAEQKNSLRDRLRAGTDIKIFEDVVSSSADGERSDTDTVVTISDKRINWSDVKVLMSGADHHATLAEFYVDNDEERMQRLEEYIDNTLMVDKARAAGMDKDPEFFKRTAEYRKTHLINIYRSNLVAKWKPSEDELKTAFVDNMDKISVPETRKVQMVVVKTKKEAESIKSEIDSGKITMFQAAQQYSIDPNAKRTLGDMGWVSQGTGFKELDDFTFNLEPEVVSGPVESPAGWHLVKVLDVNDALYENFDDPQVRQLTLRLYMQKKFSDYVIDLRKNHFEVAVFEDELNRNFQSEADYIAELTIKAKEQDSVTKQRLQDLQKWITPAAE
ncbi:MAG: peptidylprolyl isomerase [Proteobacteria bacterium]|nr:peptidylprolyl isomerase [Pseudomonadota bacterium]